MRPALLQDLNKSPTPFSLQICEVSETNLKLQGLEQTLKLRWSTSQSLKLTPETYIAA